MFGGKKDENAAKTEAGDKKQDEQKEQNEFAQHAQAEVVYEEPE